MRRPLISLFFFFNDTAPPEISTLSLHAALPILIRVGPATEAMNLDEAAIAAAVKRRARKKRTARRDFGVPPEALEEPHPVEIAHGSVATLQELQPEPLGREQDLVAEAKQPDHDV